MDVRLCTSAGIIEVELDERNAPLHTRNFLRYVDSGFYSGTIFHRVVPDSMVQGGSYDTMLTRRRPGEPVASEAANGLSNLRGTIAASRGDDPDSATSQFFFNLADNRHLDRAGASAGYTVFGRVTAGLDVLDRISRSPTRNEGNLTEMPMPPVMLDSATVLDRARPFGLSVEPDPATLQQRFAAAAARADAASILAAVDDLRRSCIALSAAQSIAEAEAAIDLGNVDRARYSLEQYLASTDASGLTAARARQILAALPDPLQSNVRERVAHCSRPDSPAIPDGQIANLAAMQAAESAVVRYRQLGRLYLACLAQVIDGGDLSELQAIDATGIYNDMVVEMTSVASRFNSSARSFKALSN